MKMIVSLLALLLVSACSSFDLPEKEVSEKYIAVNTPVFIAKDMLINAKTASIGKTAPLELQLKKSVINSIFSKMASHLQKDAVINFLKSEQFIREKKSVLGIKYVNYLTINSGKINLDLKSLELAESKANKLSAALDIAGSGSISLSGKYIGIPGSVTPKVSISMQENLNFEIKNTQSGILELHPVNKKMLLKLYIGIDFLGWEVPWNEEIELNSEDLLQPMKIPLGIAQQIELPLIADDKEELIEMVPCDFTPKNPQIATDSKKIYFKSSLEIKKSPQSVPYEKFRSK